MKYTADFETTTIEPAHVWAWGICEIENPNKWYYGEDISRFFDCCEKMENPVLYFHNLKFDGSFILQWLLQKGFKWRENRKDCNGHDFTTLITGEGNFYTIEVYFQKLDKKKPRKVTFYDSLKLLNFPVRDVAKAFGLPIAKGEIDYNRHNTPCEVTPEEKYYLKNDVQIMALALRRMFEEGFSKITIGSCALSDYKDFIGKKEFERLFPQLQPEDDSAIRASYKGGFTFANPEHRNEDVSAGFVLDVNSLYPYVMHAKELPYGNPVKFSGKYPENSKYPLYTITIRCYFDLKPGYLPTIQIKHSRFYEKTEYLTSSKNAAGVDSLATLTLTSVDFELFQKHYNIYCLEYLGGYMFKSTKNLFAKWVEKWTAKKIEATKNKNKGLRTIAKLMLNSLYGKFGTNPKGSKKFPYLSEVSGALKFSLVRHKLCDEEGRPILTETGQEETTSIEMRESLYIPVATFVTSWARYITITTSQKIHESEKLANGKSRYLYSDTDSIHLIGETIPEGIFVDETILGAWKLESRFIMARFIQAKRYIEVEKETTETGKLFKLKITCAGLPANSYKYVTWENFKPGTTYGGKLIPKQVCGGCILQETLFTLK